MSFLQNNANALWTCTSMHGIHQMIQISFKPAIDDNVIIPVSCKVSKIMLVPQTSQRSVSIRKVETSYPFSYCAGVSLYLFCTVQTIDCSIQNFFVSYSRNVV